MNSDTKYLLALAVAVVLVAGALTLPLVDDNIADAKKKSKSKKYSGKKQKVSFENESGKGGSGGSGGIASGGAGGSGQPVTVDHQLQVMEERQVPQDQLMVALVDPLVQVALVETAAMPMLLQ